MYTNSPIARCGVRQMFFQWIVFGFPTVEFDVASEALHVVDAILGWAVEETGACELIHASIYFIYF